MTNSKNVKQVSRLTGALLARKGAAIPSPERSSNNRDAMKGYLEDAIDSAKDRVDHKNISLKNKIKGSSTSDNKRLKKGKGSTVSPKSDSTSNNQKQGRRIAMTLRMDEESHLKLRIYSAYTRKSCQVILSEALDLYLEENKNKVSLLKVASQNSKIASQK